MTEKEEEKIDVAVILEQIKERIPSHYGKIIECDSGWHELICECHLELVKIDPMYEVYQIKEKFGSLRYYFGTKSNDFKEAAMWEISMKYEKLSFEVCEITGKPGKLMHKQGIYKTLAEEYEKEGWEPVERVSVDRVFGI